MGPTNRNSFLRPLKNKGFKEAAVTRIGLYTIVKSTTLESNKSHARMAVPIPTPSSVRHMGLGRVGDDL